MKKLTNTLISFAMAGILSGGYALGQQAPAAGTSPAQGTAAPKSSTTTKSAAGSHAAGTAKAGAAAGAKKPATTGAPLKTDKQKASYSIGQNIGRGLKRDELDVDLASLTRGIREALAGTKPALSDDEQKAALTALAASVRAKQQAKFAATGAANKKEGEEFLAANKAKEGVVALPSGLQYRILTEGTGPKPTATDRVSCNYRGTLVNGKEFDNSAKHGGQPVNFPVNGVIKGWTEALQLMPVGSKWQLFVPPDLAYGANGAGQDIGPNSTLIFDVELVSIAPKPEAAKPADPQPEAPKPDAKPETNR